MSRLLIGGLPPTHPGVGFLADDRRVNGPAEGEPLIHVPPPGRRGVQSCSDDRLVAPELVAGLRPSGGVAFPVGRGGEPVYTKAIGNPALESGV